MANEGKIITMRDRNYEIIGENRLTARVFEAIAARSGIIMDALDRARIASFDKSEDEKEMPSYKHTVLLGTDEEGKRLRAGIAVFKNSVVVQTLKEV